MATTSARPAAAGIDLQETARKHLWMHFSRMGGYDGDHEIPIIARGEGAYVWDDHGNRYLDGLSALFCCNAGHGRADYGEAAAAQIRELDFYTNWSYAHPRSIELAQLSPNWHPATSTASSSPTAGRRRSSPRSRSRATGTGPTAAASAPRSSPARSPTTARRWGR